MPNQLPSIAIDAPTAVLTAALDEYGAVIVEDFLSPEVLRVLNGELDGLLASEAGRHQDFVNPEIAAFFGDKWGECRHSFAIQNEYMDWRE